MLSDPAIDKVLHFRRTTVILLLVGVLLLVPLMALLFRAHRASEGSMLPYLGASKHKTLVVYHFYEQQPHHDNFLFFLKHGMHGSADFLFVLNGNVSEEIDASLPEQLPNVRVIRRNNTCFDLGSHGVVLDQLEAEGRLAQYTAIILMNASIIGPMLPTYITECWTRIFTNRLSGPVGLVGTTMNCVAPDANGGFGGYVPHLQSMILAFSPAALAAVRPVLECYDTKLEAIFKAEVPFMNMVLSAGLQASLLDGPIASPIKEVPQCQTFNVYRPGGHYGVDLNPYEVVFFKTGQQVSDSYVPLYKGFMALRNYSSWDYC